MNKRETVQALMDAVQKGDFESAKTMLADDFQFSGPVPQPISGEAWLGMSANLKAAFPDLDYNFNIESVDRDTVNIAAELKGTHKRDLDLTSMKWALSRPPTNPLKQRMNMGWLRCVTEKSPPGQWMAPRVLAC